MSQHARNNPQEAALSYRRQELAMGNWYERQMMDAHKNISLCVKCGGYPAHAISDPLYREDGSGPYCEVCFHKDPLVEAIEDVRSKHEPIP